MLFESTHNPETPPSKEKAKKHKWFFRFLWYHLVTIAIVRTREHTMEKNGKVTLMRFQDKAQDSYKNLCSSFF